MNSYLLLADAVLALHAATVLFVVGFQLLILLGGPLGWRFVRWRRLRLGHLALMAFIALQTWLDQLCPLTVLEQWLRRQGGDDSYGVSFIEHWLSRLLFFEAPWWMFVATYSAFFGIVIFSWWRWPPRRASS